MNELMKIIEMTMVRHFFYSLGVSQHRDSCCESCSDVSHRHYSRNTKSEGGLLAALFIVLGLTLVMEKPWKETEEQIFLPCIVHS